MVKVEFEYRDEYCRDGKWSKQTYIGKSVQDCIEWYGLNECVYRIISVEEED